MNPTPNNIITVLFNFVQSIFIRYKSWIIIIIIYYIYKKIFLVNKSYIKKNTTLVLHINSNHLSQTKEFVETIFAIRDAKNNQKINLLHLDVSQIANLNNQLSYSYSVLEELRDTLVDFGKEKEITAWSTNYDIKSYYLASVADTIRINTGGAILLNGMHFESTFYTNLLKKIKLPIKTFKAEGNTHKGALENVTLTEFSEENKEQIKEYLDQVIEVVIKTIEKSINDRNKNKGCYSKDIELENIIFTDNDEAIGLGIIDKEVHFDELYNKQKQPGFLQMFIDPENRLMPQLLKGTYIEITDYIKNVNVIKDTVILFINGQLGNGLLSKGVDEEKIKREVDYILRNKYIIKNIIIAIDSPGGAVTSGVTIFHYLNKLRKDIDVEFNITVMHGSMAASGGYWLSVISNNIISRNLCITGSIGVFSMLPDFQTFLKELGITYDSIYNENNFMTNLIADSDNKIKDNFQKSIDNIYRKFKKHIKDNRQKKINFATSGGGRIFSGSTALEHNLVDEVSDIYNLVKTLNKNNKIVGIPTIINLTKSNSNSMFSGATSLIKNFKKINFVIHNLQEYIKNNNI